MIPSADIAIITALKEELDPVLDLMGGESRLRKFPIQRFEHFVGTVSGANETPLSIVATSLVEVGAESTAAAVVRIMRVRPRLIVMPGICAGWESKGVRLGDVLVSDAAFNPEAGKRTDTVMEHDGKSIAPPAFLLQWLRQHNHINWSDSLKDAAPTPLSSYAGQLLCILANSESLAQFQTKKHIQHKTLTRSIELLRREGLLKKSDHGVTKKGKAWLEEFCKQKQGRWQYIVSNPAPKVHVGGFASTSAVRTDAPFPALAVKMRKVRGIDMEINSLLRAAHECQVPAFAVKGVCDFADWRKDDGFHDYAATVAAHWAFDFFRTHTDSIRALSRPEGYSSSSEPRHDLRPADTGTVSSLEQNSHALGRSTEISALLGALRDTSRTSIVVTGETGIGKTTLVAETLARFRSELEAAGEPTPRVAWMTAQKTASDCGAGNRVANAITTILDILLHFCSQLAIPTKSLTAVENCWSEIVRRLEVEPAILVVDGMEHVQVDGAFLKQVRDLPPSSKFIITTTSWLSATSLPWCFTKELGPLNDDTIDALIVRRNAGSKLGIPMSVRHDLVSACRGNPKIAELLVTYYEFNGVTPKINQQIHTLRASAFASLFESRMASSLTKRQKEVLSVMVCFPGPVEDDLARRICHQEQTEWAQLKADLGELRLLAVDANGLISVHDIVRNALYQAAEGEAHSARRRIAQWLSDEVTARPLWETNSEQTAELMRFLPVMRSLLETKGPAILSSSVTLVAAFLLHVRGEWGDAVRYLHRVSNRSKPDYTSVRAMVLLGRHFAHRQELHNAIRILTNAKQIAKLIDNLELEAEALMRIGHAYVNAGRSAQSIAMLNKAVLLAEAAKVDRIKISAVGYLADSLNQETRHTEALELLDAHLPSALGMWERAAAYYMCLRGDAYAGLGRYAEASQCFDFAKQRGKEWCDTRLSAWSQLGTGRVTWNRAAVTEALQIFQRSGMVRESGFAVKLINEIDAMIVLPKKIFVIGAPAAGKTLARQMLLRIARSYTVKLDSFDLDSIHRAIEGDRNIPGVIRYENDGSMTLLRPKAQVPRALSAFKTRCASAEKSGGFIAELAHKRMGSVLLDFGEAVLRSSLLVQLTCKKALRRARNAARSGARVPAAIVEQYQPSLSESAVAKLINMGARFEAIENESGRQELGKRCKRLWNRYYQEQRSAEA